MDRSKRRRLFADLRRAHWRVEIANSGHLKIWNPAGQLITTTTASKPSDCYGDTKLLRDLRVAGFDWQPGRRKGHHVPKQRNPTDGGTS